MSLGAWKVVVGPNTKHVVEGGSCLNQRWSPPFHIVVAERSNAYQGDFEHYNLLFNYTNCPLFYLDEQIYYEHIVIKDRIIHSITYLVSKRKTQNHNVNRPLKSD